MGRWGVAAWAALACVALSGCEQVELTQDRFRDLTPYEAYQESLTEAGLGDTALGRDWLTAGRNALDEAVHVSLPFEERGFITVEDPGAQAYRITIARGQKLTVSVSMTSEEESRLFIDLFRIPSDESDRLRPVVSLDSLPGDFVHEPWRGGDYLLRLQPELLRGGQYHVSLRLDAQLAFPVEGHGMRSILSLFGVARDGGRRSHAGVDIFAPRGTPVLATSAGTINRVDVTGLGGKVVWLRDPVRNANIYFAHLDSQYVSNGDRVEAGDTVGFIGNTGNAITTPPHLHFGVYRRGEGAVDPYPFLQQPSGTLAELTADVDDLGEWVRVQTDGIRMRDAPSGNGTVLRELGEHTPARVLGASGAYYRVRLPDGAAGYVAARLTESMSEPVAAQRVATPGPLRTAPTPGAPEVARVASGTDVPVLGRFGTFLLIEAPDGARGWIAEAVAQQD
ncbi:MAG: M23 family metallopeptidase [Gemmatimonadota bacterium]